ncbi:Sushi, von Willebrand factor type A, EGF and pentraxin domain-containing protein 1 [Quillaja saponaria]|uniref:Sushi, von Willebrand factor type A, EGF and pentraxin domain-containing protein 1 n=1 Tax=Quillaja saponaria TaxID=32244 RepID=A0AAD7VG55_QUISA|nr:Sushi, von Willebrand factor type A, EGF and pentraxin domain-containing protein 1 [Quillaja saponaria]
MAMASWSMGMCSYEKTRVFQVLCRKRDRERNRDNYPYKVVEITPPPRSLGIRCFPSNLQCGESVTIEGQTYTISAVTHRYQLRKGKYEPSEKRLDVLSTGRYILNLYLENLLEQS